MPFASVSELAGLTKAPVPVAAHVTGVPCCATPLRVTATRSGLARAAPAAADWLSPLALADFWMAGVDVPVGPPLDPHPHPATVIPMAHTMRTNLHLMATVLSSGVSR
jgi:hypothetical protein